MKQKNLTAVALAIIVAGCILVYSPVTTFEFVIMDDFKHLHENPLMLNPNFESLMEFWKAPFFYLYIPITYTFWMLVAKLSFIFTGTFSPAFFHTTNFVFHTLNSILVFLLCFRVLQFTEEQPKANKIEATKTRQLKAALLGALLFVFHPVQVEPIAWASGFKDLLSSFLALICLLLYLEPNFSRKKYLLSTLFFSLAAFSKPNTIVLPILLGFSHCLLFKSKVKQHVKLLSPWLLMGLLLVIVTKSSQPNLRIVYLAPFWQRFFIAGEALYEYLIQIFIPIAYIPDYPNAPARIVNEPTFYIRWILPAFFCLLVWFKRKTSQIYRIGLIIFIVNLLPVLGFVPFEFQNFSTISDRYLYFSIIGLALMLTGSSSHWLLRNSKANYAVVGILLALGVRTARQVWVWQNSRSLFEYTVSINPTSYLGWYSLAGVSVREGKQEDALYFYQKASEVLPNSIDALLAVGTSFISLGRYEEALNHFQRCLAIIQTDQTHYFQPTVARMRNNLAAVYIRLDRKQEAIKELEEALRIDPNYQEARRNLEALLTAQRS